LSMSYHIAPIHPRNMDISSLQFDSLPLCWYLVIHEVVV
jgi:hypothetical protein